MRPVVADAVTAGDTALVNTMKSSEAKSMTEVGEEG